MQQAHSLKRCVIIINPRSTHAHRSMKFVRQLEALFTGDNIDIITPTKRDYENPSALITALKPKLNRNTLLGIAGGDGSIHYIINLLLSHPSMGESARQAVLLPLWGGNANDLAYMANGFAVGKHMDTILKEGTVVDVYPLRVSTTHNNITLRTYAICYASFGASAFVAHKLNQPGHRDKRVYRVPGTRAVFEAGSVTKALVDAKGFRCEIDGVTQKLYDLMLVNGSRIAKVDRAPIKLTDPYFYEIRTTHNRPVVLGYAASLVRNITQRRPPIAIRSLIAHDPTWVQLDGEVEQVPSGSTVKVIRNDVPLRLLSTKLTNR